MSKRYEFQCKDVDGSLIASGKVWAEDEFVADDKVQEMLEEKNISCASYDIKEIDKTE